MAAGEAALALVAHAVTAFAEGNNFFKCAFALELFIEHAVVFLGMFRVDIAAHDLAVEGRVNQDADEGDAVAAILGQADFGLVLVGDETATQKHRAQQPRAGLP